MNFYLIAIIGIIVSAGIYWQSRLHNRDDRTWLYFFDDGDTDWLDYAPTRLKIALSIGYIIVIGMMGYAIIVFFDPEKQFEKEAGVLFLSMSNCRWRYDQ